MQRTEAIIADSRRYLQLLPMMTGAVIAGSIAVVTAIRVRRICARGATDGLGGRLPDVEMRAYGFDHEPLRGNHLRALLERHLLVVVAECHQPSSIYLSRVT